MMMMLIIIMIMIPFTGSLAVVSKAALPNLKIFPLVVTSFELVPFGTP